MTKGYFFHTFTQWKTYNYNGAKYQAVIILDNEIDFRIENKNFESNLKHIIFKMQKKINKNKNKNDVFTSKIISAVWEVW